MVQTLQPGQDWMWCYVDEVTLREINGGWVEVDLFFEAGLGYMRDHLQAGGDAGLNEDFTPGKGFSLRGWGGEMRPRAGAGELDEGQRAQLDELPGLRWDA